MKIISVMLLFAMVAINFEMFYARYLLVKLDEVKGKEMEFNSGPEDYQSRILGGSISSPINLHAHAPGSKPYLVFIWDVRATEMHNQGQHACTGVIIGRKHILTAMHCYDNRKTNSLARHSYDEKIQNRRIYFGIYDAGGRSEAKNNRAHPGINRNPTKSPVWRLPKSVKGLVKSCIPLIGCSYTSTVLYKKDLQTNTVITNLFAGRGFEDYNIDENLIDLALVEVDAVQSVDNYEYRDENDPNNVFRPLKAAEIDKVQSGSNNCNTCSGDCSDGKIFNAQGWGRYGRSLSSSNRPRFIRMKCTRNCRTMTGNENKCERFADADDLGWMKKFCVISSANPSDKTTCVGDSGSPLTRAAEELRYSHYHDVQPILQSVFVVTGILSGQACSGSNCSPGPERDASAYVNLKDQDIRTFLSNEVTDLKLF